MVLTILMETRQLWYEFDEIAHTHHPDSENQRKIPQS